MVAFGIILFFVLVVPFWSDEYTPCIVHILKTFENEKIYRMQYLLEYLVLSNDAESPKLHVNEIRI